MRRRFWWMLVAGLLAILSLPTASAFVTFSSASAEHRKAFENYYVWNNNVGSLVADHYRGLGGGLEYSVTPELCPQLLPRFVDTPRPTCGALYGAIHAGLARWAVGQSAITFRNVSAEVAVSIVPQKGAEIDILVRPLELPAPPGSAAWTKLYEVAHETRRTYEATAAMEQIQSADIVITNASNACFFLDAQHPRAHCNHFPSLIVHEVGHALGLDHPDEFPDVNVDSDQDPSTPIQIDCQDPRNALQAGAPVSPDAVMRSADGQPNPVHMTLTADDLGGRDFLYPPCGAPPKETGPQVERPSPPQTTFPVPVKTADGGGLSGTIVGVFVGLIVGGYLRRPR